MAATHGKSAQFYLTDSGSTERNITAGLTSAAIARTADVAETSALGDSAKTYVAGLKDATIPLGGPRDATIEGYVEGVVGTSTAFAYFPEGSASGKIKYSGSVIITAYNPSSSVDDATRWSAECQVTGAVTRAAV